MEILAIPEPTPESEARKNELIEKQKFGGGISEEESKELFALKMRQFWCSEC